MVSCAYMQSMKEHWVLVGAGIALVVLAGALAYVTKAPAPAAPAPEAPSIASTTGTAIVPQKAKPATAPFPMNAADAPVPATFQGSYAGNAASSATANADIAALAGLLGKGKYDDYNLYDGIANDYVLLGEGALAYEYYNRAIGLHPNEGLAYVNAANLFEQVGAYATAADAYAKAVAVQPAVLEYHIERLHFLTNRFASDTARVTAALADAARQFGDTPAILTIQAQWLTGQKQYAAAIKVWQTVKTLSSADRQASIDAEIARLQAKQ